MISILYDRLDNFIECCMQIPELGVHMENGINIDPIPLTVEEFTVAGDLDGKVCILSRYFHRYSRCPSD